MPVFRFSAAHSRNAYIQISSSLGIALEAEFINNNLYRCFTEQSNAYTHGMIALGMLILMIIRQVCSCKSRCRMSRTRLMQQATRRSTFRRCKCVVLFWLAVLGVLQIGKNRVDCAGIREISVRPGAGLTEFRVRQH